MPGDGDTLCEDACDDDGYKGSAGQKPGRSFTWRELSKLNKRHNAHVAYRGKVSDFLCALFCIIDVYIMLTCPA